MLLKTSLHNFEIQYKTLQRRNSHQRNADTSYPTFGAGVWGLDTSSLHQHIHTLYRTQRHFLYLHIVTFLSKWISDPATNRID